MHFIANKTYTGMLPPCVEDLNFIGHLPVPYITGLTGMTPRMPLTQQKLNPCQRAVHPRENPPV
jgi:hypothetical protein